MLGFDQAALDTAARQGFAEGAFEESEEEGASIVEEFYPENSDDGSAAIPIVTGPKLGLAAKLDQLYFHVTLKITK